MNTLRISPDLELPLDAVTQKFAWLGRSGSGKTFACKRFVEQMLIAKTQVVILDSVGVWFGLRQGPKGFDVPVLGGLYGDMPLEPSAGALVAEVAVSHGASLVLDLSQMSDAGRARFAAAFGARLFELKKASPGAMHVVLDEGQDYVPQDPEKNENVMLHEWVRIAKQGRAFGIGLSIVSQRPQEISKKALNQAECVVAFQLTGPHERKALEYWLADKGLETKLSTMLTTLEIGCPFVWSPQWLKMSRVIERVLHIDSADTSQTPKVGVQARVHALMKPIDLDALRAGMATALEESKENDPKLLRARIAELEKAQSKGATAPTPVVPKVDKKKAEALVRTLSGRKTTIAIISHTARGLQQELEATVQRMREKLAALEDYVATDRSTMELEELLDGVDHDTVPVAKPAPRTKTPKVISAVTRADSTGDSSLPSGETAVLKAVFQYGERTAPFPAVALMTGYAARSITNYVGRLAAAGLVERVPGGLLITEAGKAQVPAGTKPYPRGKALIEHLIRTLPDGESRVLAEVLGTHPQAAQIQSIQVATKYAPRSITNYVGRLTSRRAIVRAGRGALKIHPEVLK